MLNSFIDSVFYSSYAEKNLNFDINTVLNQLSKSNLTPEDRKKVYLAFFDFLVGSTMEEININAAKRFVIYDDFSTAIENDFRDDLIKLIERYKKKYPSQLTSLHLDLIQLNLLGKIEDLQKDWNEPMTLEQEEAVKTLLRKTQRGRPRSAEYDKLLITLKDILSDEKGFYMPQLIEILTIVDSEYPNFFNGFEINENSIRTKISKSQNLSIP